MGKGVLITTIGTILNIIVGLGISVFYIWKIVDAFRFGTMLEGFLTIIIGAIILTVIEFALYFAIAFTFMFLAKLISKGELP